MKQAIFLVIVLLLAGCTILGSELGSAVDDSSLGDEGNKKKYKNKYAAEGFEADVAIIKSIFSSNNKKVIDTRPCSGSELVQVCSTTKGCWCEKVK